MMVEVTACNNTTDTETQTRTGQGEQVSLNRFILMCVSKKTNKQTNDGKIRTIRTSTTQIHGHATQTRRRNDNNMNTHVIGWDNVI